MNIGLEFHDSHVESIEPFIGGFRVLFETAYLHHSLGRPGIDAGTGYVQAADLTFGSATCQSVSPECLGPISSGTVCVNAVDYPILPVPFDGAGTISAEFVFATGAVFRVTAATVSCETRGPARFVETYAA